MLAVENLTVWADNQTLVQDISFRVDAGEMLCIIGESGAGKSTVLKALQGLMPATAAAFSFEPAGLHLSGQMPRTLGLPNTRWVMQDPLAALDPRFTLGRSIAESLHDQRPSPKDRAAAVAVALAAVELDPEFADRYPAQVSLGQAQRACLARALIAQPNLVLFDEPLSALDALVQKKIAHRMDVLRRETGMGYVVVTHDLGFAATYADHIVLLRKGRVEAAQTKTAFFAEPKSSYAQDLISAARSLGALCEGQAA